MADADLTKKQRSGAAEMTLSDAYAQGRYEEYLYGSDICEAFWLYCYQRREERRFWRLWQVRYGRQPTTREGNMIQHWIASQAIL